MTTQDQINRALELGVPSIAIQQWVHGDKIQDVMPWLSADDREFILTGLSPEEWDNMSMRGWKSMENLTKLDFEQFCNRNGNDPSEVQRVWEQVKHEGVYLGGGALRRTLINQPLDSDFDFFFHNQGTLDSWEASLPKTMKLVRETQHHKEYRGTLVGSDTPVTLQAIRFSFYNGVWDVIDSFDYTITQFAFDGESLYTTPEALWDLGRRRLAIHKVTYPVSTMRRMLKYSNQGFTACGGCMQTLFQETLNSPGALYQMDITYVD